MKVKRFHSDAILPTYGSPGAAGADLYALEEYRLEEGRPMKLRVGVGFEIPPGYEGEIRVRSSLAAKGMAVAQGTIDSDYRGEVSVVANLIPGSWPLTLKKGDRIAQIVFSPCEQAEFVEVEELATTERGDGGFGSNGR